MKFGLLYEIEVPAEREGYTEAQAFQEAMDQCVYAEQMGFDYVWFVEHHFLTEFAHSTAPDAVLGALSQRTSVIRLGFGVVLLPSPINHPIRVAERVATLDIISNGRAEFGTGRSSTRYQLAPFEVPPADTRGMWREAVSIIPRMWTEKVFSHQGEYFKIEPREVIPRPIQKPHPPIWVAANQHDTFEMAGEMGIGALSFTVGEPQEMEARVRIYRDALARANPVGQFINNQFAAFTVSHCQENDRQARDLGGPEAKWYHSHARKWLSDWKNVPTDQIPDEYRYHAEKMGRDVYMGKELQYDDLIDRRIYCIGSPDACIQTIEAYEAYGVDQFLPLVQFGSIPHDKVMETLRLYGKYIIPHFKEKEQRQAAGKRVQDTAT